jgi:molybdopterin synthase catalytic subunit
MASPPAIIDVQLVHRPVDAVAIEPFPMQAGAECIFLGHTRHEVDPQHGSLRRLSYQAYEAMARGILENLACDAVKQFNCLAVRIHHAVGEVPLGKASVLVQVACAHRAAAFDACRFLIDQLKATAPIWKNEQWERGATWTDGAVVDAAELV